jgi:hypothetical protein
MKGYHRVKSLSQGDGIVFSSVVLDIQCILNEISIIKFIDFL